MLNEARTHYTYTAASGADAELVRGTTFGAHVGMCGWVLRNERSLLFGETSTHWMDETTTWEAGQESAVLVPLIGRKGIIGGLSALGKLGGGCFTQHDLDLLTMFANQVSIAIENAQLFREVRQEIEERKRTEAAVRRSEDKYRRLFENMTAAFALHEMIYDRSGQPVDYRFLEVNPAFERLTGLRADDVVGRTVKEVMPDTEQYWIDTYSKVVKTGDPVTYENYSRELGRYFDVRAFYFAYRQFAVVFSDVTERRQAEQDREKLIDDLQKALAEIKTLHGVLPICSSCKRIRDDEGSWVQLEWYIRQHSDAEFSHGLCQECLKKLYPDKWKKIQESEKKS